MRYLRIKLTGYIGIFNGMGLDFIDIDFTKCLHNIVVIKGMNGVGKSTLLSALNVFPDGSSSFIPYKDAKKEIVISDDVNIYEIQITSPADNNGGRKVTKAFIQKNGVELNSNGNVSSYKDIVFTEFELDSNFLSLTSLTSEKKGLGTLTPAERKKFVSSIIDNLEVYNDMYKNLNKKSSVFKSHINNLHTKIQNIGSRDSVETVLNSLKGKSASISGRIMELNNAIVSLQTKYTIDEEEAAKLNKVNSDLEQLNKSIDALKPDLNTLARKTGVSSKDIETVYEEHKQALSKYDVELASSKERWTNATHKYNDNAYSITSIKAELSTYDNSEDNDIESKYIESKSKIDKLVSDISSYGFAADESLIYPLKSLIEFINNLCKEIDALYYESSIEDMQYIVYDFKEDMQSFLQKNLEDTYAAISAHKIELESYQDKLRILSVLDNRPKGCKIDDCPFIKEAINIKSSIGDKKIITRIDRLHELLDTFSKDCTKISDLIVLEQERVHKRTIYGRIRNSISENLELLQKFNISELYNLEIFDKLISNMNPFNNLRDPRKLIELSNLLELYSAEYKSYSLLEVRYTSYKDKERLISSNKNLLSRLEEEQRKLQEEINRYKSEYDNFYGLKNSISGKLADEEKYITLHKTLLDLESHREDCNKILEEYSSKSSKAVEAMNTINGYNEEIVRLNREIEPINMEINRLSGQLTLLDSFESDFSTYNQKYQTIETLKKYCSSTTGIQTLFFQMYMSKTLDLANQLLGMLFNGEYRLLDFVINANEFRIPFIGNGLAVDDISSGSSSQIAMMSLVINMALLYQASSHYNIVSMDELDAGLDHYAREAFVSVLYRMISILNIEQLFIISHSIELNSSNTDIIKLKSYDDYESEDGNIIWNYSDVIKMDV